MIHRDRNGQTYKIDIHPLPPPSSEKNANMLFYQLKEANEVINELLDRVYELEQVCAKELPPSVPPPSVEY